MLKLLKNLSKKEWFMVGLSVLFIVIQVWLDLKIPTYMSEITTKVQTEADAMSAILSLGAKMLLCAFGSLAASVVVAVQAASIASRFAARLRKKLFHKVLDFSMEEINDFSTPSLVTRSTNDITQVQTLIIMGLQVMVKAPIMASLAIAKISNKSWQWTLSTTVAILILLVFVGICIALAYPRFQRLQRLTDNLNKVTRENLTGIRVVRAYNAETYQETKFDDANNQLTSTNLFTNRIMAILMPMIFLIMNGLSLSVYWIGAYLIDNANMIDKIALFSDMVVFLNYAMQIVMSFMMLVMIFLMMPRSMVSARRILEVLDRKPTIIDGMGSIIQNNKKGEVEFRNVSFQYPDAEEAVIENISFTARKGETVALIGSTGSGKTTLINLIPRFYDVTEGEVLVNGVNVKEYRQKDLRNIIGYVSQKAVLFRGTIESNIVFGDHGKDGFLPSDIVEVAEVSQATEFIDQMEKNYESDVAQGGTNLSGGQKQRISIARSVSRRPDIFIFDDTFSALDYKTDRKLREALRKHCNNATKLIVAQRIGTIMDANQIIVLDDGKIVGKGTHKELMNTCEVYQQIALSQLSKEELA